MRPWQGDHVSDLGDPVNEKAPSRRRNFWQLDIPMVLAVIMCSVFTVIEVRRAGEGVGRAWAYAVEWPMIGLFCVWIWYRYRKEGSITKGFSDRWKNRVAQLNTPAAASVPTSVEVWPPDPDLAAWQSYVDELQLREPPGRPPDESVTN